MIGNLRDRKIRMAENQPRLLGYSLIHIQTKVTGLRPCVLARLTTSTASV